MNDTNEILDEAILNDDTNLIQASKGKRFANYLIDMIVFYIAFTAIFVALLLGTNSADSLLEEDAGNDLMLQLVGIVFLIIFYTALEFGLKGKTIGKYITKTRVVNLDGSAPTLGTALKRSLSRVVPFEPFSYLGQKNSGWHDRWTDTIVIDENLS